MRAATKKDSATTDSKWADMDEAIDDESMPPRAGMPYGGPTKGSIRAGTSPSPSGRAAQPQASAKSPAPQQATATLLQGTNRQRGPPLERPPQTAPPSPPAPTDWKVQKREQKRQANFEKRQRQKEKRAAVDGEAAAGAP